jgi:hypothetical protein
MTDEQIIKASKICGNNENCCKCPYYRSPSEIAIDCNDRLTLDALDLIKRQQAEIEVLKKGGNKIDSLGLVATLMDQKERLVRAKNEWEREVRSEAVREFAEFLIDKAENNVIRIGDLCNYVVDFNLTEKKGGLEWN